KTAQGLSVALQDGRKMDVDAVLYATGRVPNVAGLGLDAAGVVRGKDDAIVVDKHYTTNVPSIHALGDVTARMQLTPIALAEAMALVDHLFGDGKRAMSYEFVPT